MASTLTPSQPHNTIGPGLPLLLNVDGATAPGATHWTLTISATPFPSPPFLEQTGLCAPDSSVDLGVMFPSSNAATFGNNGWAARTDDSVTATVQIFNASNVQLEQVSTSFSWDHQQGLGWLLAQQNQSGTGGFTTTDRTNLQTILSAAQNVLGEVPATLTTAAGVVNQTIAQMLSGHTLDALTLEEVTSGCTAGKVTFSTGNKLVSGVIVRVCTFPNSWTPWSPDGDYYLPDFAVITIFRGSDKVRRVPVHTSSVYYYPLPGYAQAVLPDILANIQPPWSSVEVDFANGVTGQVFRVQFP